MLGVNNHNIEKEKKIKTITTTRMTTNFSNKLIKGSFLKSIEKQNISQDKIITIKIKYVIVYEEEKCLLYYLGYLLN